MSHKRFKGIIASLVLAVTVLEQSNVVYAAETTDISENSAYDLSEETDELQDYVEEDIEIIPMILTKCGIIYKMTATI